MVIAGGLCYCHWMSTSTIGQDGFMFELNRVARLGALVHPSYVRADGVEVWPFGQKPYTTCFLEEENRALWCKLYSKLALGEHSSTMALDFGNVISTHTDDQLRALFKANVVADAYNWGIVSYVPRGRYSRCFETNETVNFSYWAPFLILVTSRVSRGSIEIEYPVDIFIEEHLKLEEFNTKHVIVVHGSKYDAFCLLGRPVLLFDDRDDNCAMARECGGDARLVLKQRNQFWKQPICFKGMWFRISEGIISWPRVMKAFSKAHERLHGEGGECTHDPLAEHHVETLTDQAVFENPPVVEIEESEDDDIRLHDRPVCEPSSSSGWHGHAIPLHPLISQSNILRGKPPPAKCNVAVCRGKPPPTALVSSVISKTEAGSASVLGKRSSSPPVASALPRVKPPPPPPKMARPKRPPPVPTWTDESTYPLPIWIVRKKRGEDPMCEQCKERVATKQCPNKSCYLGNAWRCTPCYDRHVQVCYDDYEWSDDEEPDEEPWS